MLNSFNFSAFFPQIRTTLKVLKDTTPFIRKHKLWKGFFDHKWVLTMTILVSVIFSFIVYRNLIPSIDPEQLDLAVQAGLGPEMTEMVDGAKSEGKKGAFFSGTKYLLIIFLEVIIFHFSMKTLSILTNGNRVLQFRDFVVAEKRMIKVMAVNFIKGVIVQALLFIGLSMIGMKVLSPFLMFFVYAYFIGYALLDNYNEQFARTIKQSQAIIRQHLGAAVTIGVLITGLIYIPLVGPIFAPIFGAIAAAIYGERFKIEDCVVFDDVQEVDGMLV